MAILFSLVILGAFSLLIVGMVRPTWVLTGTERTRVKVFRVYGGTLLLAFLLEVAFEDGVMEALTFTGGALSLFFIIGLINPSVVLPQGSKRTQVLLIYGVPALLFSGFINRLEDDLVVSKDSSPPPIVEVEDTRSPAPEPSPKPQGSPTPEGAPPIFQEAVNSATNAAQRSQSAATVEEWEGIANLWKESSTNMAQVPETSTYYETAQAKVREYAANAEAAQQRVAKLSTPPPIPTPIPSEPPPPTVEPTQEFVSGSCADLRAMGLSDFRPGDPNYTKGRDRNNDGVACESQ